MGILKNKYFNSRLTTFLTIRAMGWVRLLMVCLFLCLNVRFAQSSYLPTEGSNIGIGTSTPVGALTIMNGNVGIGTWSPTSILEVVGTVSADAYIGDGSGLSGVGGGTSGWMDGVANVHLTTTTDLVAIGTTTPKGALTVVGNVGIGMTDTYRNIAGPANGLIVEGNVGIGTWAADNGQLIVMGDDVGIGTTTPVGAFTVMNGNVGIGTWSPNNRLSIIGNIGIGVTEPYLDVPGPDNGIVAEGNVGIGTWAADNGQLIVMGGNVGIGTVTPAGAVAVMNGNVGIGTWSPNNTLALSGDIGIGTTTPYRAIPGPDDGMVIEGNVGIGTWAAATGKLIVMGDNVGIGTTTPADAFVIMNGNVGIGTWSPNNQLAVMGNIGIGTTLPYLRIAGPNNGIVSEGNVGIGTWATDDGKLIVMGGNMGVGTFLPAGALTVMNLNVGIGTYNAVNRLSIVGSIGVGTTEPYLNIPGPDNGIVVEGNIGIGTWAADNGKLIVMGGNVGIGTIIPVAGFAVMNGNVGIGTWSPTSILEVVDTVSATTYVGDGSGLTGLNASTGWLYSGTNLYLTTTSDLVAVGTTTPAGALIIVGNMGIGTTLPYRRIATTLNRMMVEGNVGIGTWSATGGKLIVMEGNVGIGTVSPAGALSVMNGNIGIGTWNPINRLSVIGNIGVGTTEPYLNIPGPDTGMATEGNIGIGTWAADNGKLIVMGGNVGIGTANPRGVLTVMNGNVGIGTWDPADTLSILGNISIGTTTPYRAISAPDDGMAIEGNVGIGTWVVTRGKLMIMDSNVGIGTTTPVAALAVMNGNVGIGTWSPTEIIHIRGNLRVQGSTDCILGNGAGATNCSSDIRQKDNVHEIENSLSKILSLRGVEFDWSEKSLSPGSHSIGMIAQEVQKVFPTAVVEQPNTGYQMLDYAVLVAPIIEAVKELNKQTTGLYSGFSEMVAQNAAKAAEIILLKAEADRNVQEVRRLKEENVNKENELSVIKAWICLKDSEIAFCKQEGTL